MTYPYYESGRPSRSDGLLPEPPPYLLHRHDAAVLEPRTAVMLPGQPPVQSTVYHRSRLLVTGLDQEPGLVSALAEAAAINGVVVAVDERYDYLRSAAAFLPPEREQEILQSASTRILLLPPDDRAYRPPDAWQVLQSFRELVGGDASVVPLVGLDHLMTATSMSGDWGSSSELGVVEYGVPGVGPRSPVSWFGAAPASPEPWGDGRCPVVVLLDTGVGQHPWLTGDVVRRFENATELLDDAPPFGQDADPFRQGTGFDDAHGTFVAGLVRQVCPSAHMLSVRVMRGDGAVSESELTEALVYLMIQQLAAAGGEPVDVVLLTAGYYHEWAEDPDACIPIRSAIEGLRKLGVCVVASAGNDGTSRPMVPACLADERVDTNDIAPLVSVGALNPDGQTVALFSNDGPWVTTRRPGVSSVSVMPVTYSSLQPSVDLTSTVGDIRSSLDPDDFTGGFASWSGTSFAAAVVAGEVAAKLDPAELADSDPAAGIHRARKAFAELPRR